GIHVSGDRNPRCWNRHVGTGRIHLPEEGIRSSCFQDRGLRDAPLDEISIHPQFTPDRACRLSTFVSEEGLRPSRAGWNYNLHHPEYENLGSAAFQAALGRPTRPTPLGIVQFGKRGSSSEASRF